jgi:hypothetical protein
VAVVRELLDVLTDDISREYGVNFGQDWSVGRQTTGEIVLTRTQSSYGSRPG